MIDSGSLSCFLSWLLRLKPKTSFSVNTHWATMKRIEISILNQSLKLVDQGRSKNYRVSTSRFGPGEEKDSHQTPRGKHIIRAKIGEGEPYGMIFKGRRPTGQIYNNKINSDSEDWILTRILWLSGKELGKNRLGDVDTMQRYSNSSRAGIT